MLADGWHGHPQPDGPMERRGRHTRSQRLDWGPGSRAAGWVGRKCAKPQVRRTSSVVCCTLVLCVVTLLWLAHPKPRSVEGSVCGPRHDGQGWHGFVRPTAAPAQRSWIRGRSHDKSWRSAPPPAVAFFATLKPMPQGGDEVTVIRQSNAIRSWQATHLKAEVYLFGDETVRDFARRHAVTYISDVETTAAGVPVFSDMLRRTKAETALSLLCFANADIVFAGDSFGNAVESACSVVPPTQQLLLIGQRFDVPVNDTRIEFASRATTRTQLLGMEARPEAFLQNVMYKDYFVFSRDLWPTAAGEALPLAIGRARIDDWIVHSAMVSPAAVIDATPVLRAYHQIHNYNHVSGGKAGAWSGADAQKNIRLAGDVSVLGDINRCPLQLRFDTGGDVAVYHNYGALAVTKLYKLGFFHAVRRIGATWWPWVAVVLLVVGAIGAWRIRTHPKLPQKHR